MRQKAQTLRVLRPVFTCGEMHVLSERERARIHLTRGAMAGGIMVEANSGKIATI
jgi:hypothetical protein